MCIKCNNTNRLRMRNVTMHFSSCQSAIWLRSRKLHSECDACVFMTMMRMLVLCFPLNILFFAFWVNVSLRNNGGSMNGNKTNWIEGCTWTFMKIVNVCVCLRARESIPLTWRVKFIVSIHPGRSKHVYTVIVAKHSIVTVICFISLWIRVSRSQWLVRIVLFFIIMFLVSGSSCKNQLRPN